MTKSKKYRLSVKDAVKGVIVAGITTILTGLLSALSSGALPDYSTLKGLGLAGLAAGLGYIVKNFFTNSEDVFLGKEKKSI